jgi:hypothetical protein
MWFHADARKEPTAWVQVCASLLLHSVGTRFLHVDTTLCHFLMLITMRTHTPHRAWKSWCYVVRHYCSSSSLCDGLWWFGWLNHCRSMDILYMLNCCVCFVLLLEEIKTVTESVCLILFWHSRNSHCFQFSNCWPQTRIFKWGHGLFPY